MFPRPLRHRGDRSPFAAILCVLWALLLAVPLGRSAAQSGELPVIITPPKTNHVLYGQRITLSVEATGTPPLRYQWYAGSPDDANSGAILGETNSTFTTSPLLTTSRYFVRVSNDFGYVDSLAARIDIDPEPPGIYTTRLPVVWRYGPAFPGE